MFYPSIQITPPAALPVDITEFKKFLRHTNSAEDTLLETLLWGAINEAEAYLQVSLGPQTRRTRIEGQPTRFIELDFGPVVTIESVTYTDTNGNEQSLSSASPQGFEIYGNGIKPPGDEDWPTVGPDGVFVVEYTAGSMSASSPAVALDSKLVMGIFLLGQVLYDRNPQSMSAFRDVAFRMLDTSREGQGV